MRTQLILTTAVLSVAGSLGASAQVYSVNAVGYINITIPAKSYGLIANQLNVSAANTVAEIIPSVPDDAGAIIFRYAGAAGFVANGFDFGAWSVPAMVLNPGTGFFLQNNGSVELKVTLVGEVPQGNLTTPLTTGLNLVASQVPQAGKLVADLKYAAVDGDIVFQWDTATQKYKNPNTLDFGSWTAGEPDIAVAEGFFIQRSTAGSWDRQFSVN